MDDRERRTVQTELTLLGTLVCVLAILSLAPMRASALGSGPTPPGLSATAPTQTAWTAAATLPFMDGGRLVPLVDSGRTLDEPDGVVIAVDTAQVGQTWRGVGGALTDASVDLLEGNEVAVRALFDPNAADGAGLDIVRLPLSATDFSMRWWTWELGEDMRPSDVPGEAIAAVDAITTVLSLRSDLEVIGAAWTSPPSMRTQPNRPGGDLVDVDAYGHLLLAQVEWLQAHGVPLTAVSLGNESDHVAATPTLAMSSEQMIALSNSLEPTLERRGVELLALDHNWSDGDRAAELLAAGSFDALAYHCYDGEPSVMATAPVDALITECTATTGDWYTSVGWMSRVLVGDAIRSGSTGLIMWNLALDPDHGPKLPGGCDVCRGLLTVDPDTGAITRSPEFWVLAHLSAAADPGAVVLSTERTDGLPVAVFRNPDGTIGVFGHNDRAHPVVITVDVDGTPEWHAEIPSWGVFSARG